MRIRILDRILVALAGLLMIAGVAALAAQLFFGKNVAGRVTTWLNNDSLRVYIIIAGILICLLGVYCVLLLFRHRGRDGKFVMQRTENGELAISLKALETMVQKCLEQHKEVNAQAVSLDNQKGSLLIRIRGTVAGGISIPLTVETLQQQIKQYVTACSGVEVKDIRVEIESSGPDAKDAPFKIEAPAARGLLKGTGEEPLPTTEAVKPEEKTETAAPDEKKETTEAETPAAEKPQAEDELSAAAAAAALLMNQAPEEDDDRPMHQRLFSTVEEPCVMPMPPMDLDEASKEEKEQEVEKSSTVPSDPETPEEKKPEEPVPEEKKTADETAEKETQETKENEGGVED